MKRYLFGLGWIFALVVIIFASEVGTAHAQSCCAGEGTTDGKSAPALFASLTHDEGFRTAHENPLPFRLENPKGMTVIAKAADGSECRAYEIKADKPTKNVLFVFHEWWGLNDYIKQEAERLQKNLGNTTVVAIDLYDGKVAATRDSAAKYMQGNSAERSKAIIRAFAARAGADARIATIGWCFGGGWSLQASLELGKQAAGCVMYYGMPETDPTKLTGLQAPVLGLFAGQEKWIGPEVVEKFKQAMQKAGKTLDAHSFNADHAFANPSNPKHDKKATEEANALALAFLKKRLP